MPQQGFDMLLLDSERSQSAGPWYELMRHIFCLFIQVKSGYYINE